MKLYLDSYLIWDRLSSNSRVNDGYILFVILHSHWLGNAMLWYLSVGNVLMFVMRVSFCVAITTETSIFWMASKILRYTLDEFMTEFHFSGQISMVHFVVNLLLSTFVVLVCLIWRLQTEFFSIQSKILGSVLMMTLSFLVFFNVTRLEIGSWFLYFVVDGAVSSFKECYVRVGVDGILGPCCERFWFLGLIVEILGWCWGREVFGKIHDCVCRYGTLK